MEVIAERGSWKAIPGFSSGRWKYAGSQDVCGSLPGNFVRSLTDMTIDTRNDISGPQPPWFYLAANVRPATRSPIIGKPPIHADSVQRPESPIYFNNSQTNEFCINAITHRRMMTFCYRITLKLSAFSRPSIHSGPHSQLSRAAYTFPSTAILRRQGTVKAYSQMTTTAPVVAVLYQALAPPMYGGVSKPPKPGGTWTSDILRDGY